MPAQAKPQRSSMRQSLDVPMSAFNKQLIEEAGKLSASKGHISRGYSNGSRGRKLQNPHKRSVSTSAVSRHDSIRASAQQHIRRSMSEKQSSANNTIRYTRPTGPELVSSKHPSCLGLPLAWTSIHDQFIAYMATHAPLDKNGNIPRHEEKKERWKTADIAQELVVRFPRLGGHIKPSVIEKRLILLDQAGDNDYFKMPYSAYAYEEWGRGI